MTDLVLTYFGDYAAHTAIVILKIGGGKLKVKF